MREKKKVKKEVIGTPKVDIQSKGKYYEDLFRGGK